jgi:preprotein translocase subunit SecG
MMAVTQTRMEVLGNNPVFITSGRIGLLSYFGLLFSKWFNLVDVNLALTVVVGFLSMIFLAMQIYFTYLKTRREKNEIKKLKEDDGRDNS